MKKKLSKKTILIIASVALALVIAIGVTIAFLSDVTDEYTNTFTFANGLKVTLVDEAATYKIVPGHTQAKTTNVSVQSDIDCWLYVGVKGVDTTIDGKTIVDWGIADGWTELGEATPAVAEGEDWTGYTVYYRAVTATTEDYQTYGPFDVLAGNQVSYPVGLTKADVPDGTEIKLIFKAKAIQQESFADAKAAWEGKETAPATEYPEGPLPEAVVTPITGAGLTVNAADDFGNPNGSTHEVTLDIGATFTASEEDTESAYNNWGCDFVLSFNQDVEKSNIELYGQYDAYSENWLGGPMGEGTMASTESVQLLRMLGLPVSYSDVVALHIFNCGIKVTGEYTGLTATLQLVLINPEDATDVRVVVSQDFPIN